VPRGTHPPTHPLTPRVLARGTAGSIAFVPSRSAPPAPNAMPGGREPAAAAQPARRARGGAQPKLQGLGYSAEAGGLGGARQSSSALEDMTSQAMNAGGGGGGGGAAAGRRRRLDAAALLGGGARPFFIRRPAWIKRWRGAGRDCKL
jgi:hypothetical protein